MQFEEKIVEIFLSHTECPNKEIEINTKIDSLGLSSFSYVQIIVEIEETYHIEFTMDDLRLERFVLIRDCVNRVKELIDRR